MVTREDIQATCDDIVREFSPLPPTLPIWNAWEADFSVLSEHAVDPRYPGKFASADDTAHAMHICDEVRQTVRKQLKLPFDAASN